MAADRGLRWALGGRRIIFAASARVKQLEHVNGMPDNKPRRPPQVQEGKPPERLGQVFLRWVWRLPTWIRTPILAIAGLALVLFTLVAAVPELRVSLLEPVIDVLRPADRRSFPEDAGFHHSNMRRNTTEILLRTETEINEGIKLLQRRAEDLYRKRIGMEPPTVGPFHVRLVEPDYSLSYSPRASRILDEEGAVWREDSKAIDHEAVEMLFAYTMLRHSRISLGCHENDPLDSYCSLDLPVSDNVLGGFVNSFGYDAEGIAVAWPPVGSQENEDFLDRVYCTYLGFVGPADPRCSIIPRKE